MNNEYPPMSERDALIQVIIVLSVVFYFLNLIVQSFLARLFQIQFYPHVYLKLLYLDANQIYVLSNKINFYKNLSYKDKKYFEHRIAVFIKRYAFHGKEELLITEEMKVLVAASFVLLTFRMADFKPKVFDKIIMYPNAYLSTNSGLLYKGEFNPKMRTVVFSWEDFLLGHEIKNDNLNLGLHEFTHVLQYQSKLSQSPTYIIFDDMFDKICKCFRNQKMKVEIVSSNFFRDYAFENDFELLAVLMEHFFESPKEFKLQFPKLYSYVKRMINYKE
jgi:MtfA peptidase